MFYLLLIVVGVCVGMHVWMMFKGHGGHRDEKDENNKHKHGGGCH